MPNRVVVAIALPLMLASACSSRAHQAAAPSPAATSSASAPSPSSTPPATTPAPARTASPTPTTVPTTPPGPAESVTTHTGVSTLTARIDHASAPSGTLLHLHLVVSSRAGSLNGLSVLYGDGQRYDENPVAAGMCVQPPPGGPPSAGPSSRTEDLLVSYRRRGTYTIDLRAMTDSTCAIGPTEQLHAVLQVVVTSGPRLANGPQLPGPEASIGATPVSGGTELEAFQLTDPDGVVTTVRWDLGDGTRKTVHLTGGCTDPGTRWPVDRSDGYSRLTHHYAHHATYRVRVTVISSGCHGGNLQHRTVSAQIRS